MLATGFRFPKFIIDEFLGDKSSTLELFLTCSKQRMTPCYGWTFSFTYMIKLWIVIASYFVWKYSYYSSLENKQWIQNVKRSDASTVMELLLDCFMTYFK